MLYLFSRIPRIIRKNLRAVVYGGTDGIISMFSVVSSSFGADLPLSVVVIIGLASIFADALSMATSDYMSQVAENQMEKVREDEILNAIGNDTIRSDLYLKINERNVYSPSEAEFLTNMILKDPKLVTTFMLHSSSEEDNETSESTSALSTFCSFVCFGLVPLASVVLCRSILSPFVAACFFTLLTLFALGYLKAKFTKQKAITAGLQMVLLGGASSLIAYIVALMLANLQKTNE